MRYSLKLSKLTKRLKHGVLASAFVATQMLLPMTVTQQVFAGTNDNPPGNNGTLKIHEAGTPSGTESNDPKVCSFNVEGFDFDSGQSGYLQFDVQGGDGPTGVADGPYAWGPADNTGFYATQYFSLKDGHYKATLYGKQLPGGQLDDEKAKSKVFKVTCPEIKPVIETTASSSAVELGDSVHDTATLTGDNNHGVITGSVTFHLCGPSVTVPDCSNYGTNIGSDDVDSGTAVSPDVKITEAGNYCFRASYDAPHDSSYKDATHTNKDSECFVATEAKPAQPIVSVDLNGCRENSGASDVVDVHVTNTTDNTGKTVIYTVTVDGQSHSLSLADGATGNTQFGGVAPGAHTATVTGDDGTSVTSDEFTVANCPYLPAAPTADASIVACVQNSGKTDIVNVYVTNTDDNTNQTVKYTIVLGGQTKTLTLADGATSNVQFGNLATGSYSATITGDDGTGPITTNEVAVGECPYLPAQPTATADVIACTPDTNTSDKISIRVYNTDDNTNQSVTYTIKMGGQTKTVTVPDGENRNVEFGGLAAGTYNATVQGDDGTNEITLDGIVVNDCPYLFGSISGTKFEVNANGKHVGVVGGVTICLDNDLNGLCDSVDTTTTTQNDGSFSISGLRAGAYNIIELLQNGWTKIFGGGNVDLGAGASSTGNDFGNFMNAKISGYKWNDENENGMKDSWENKLSDWSIQLFDNNGTLLETTQTNSHGRYSFDNLMPGKYTVCEVQQSGWTQTFPDPAGKHQGCHVVHVRESGHNYRHENFGNNHEEEGCQGEDCGGGGGDQGGTVTVIKNVIDNKGVTHQDVTTWFWDVDGSGHYSTGSGNTQSVTTGIHIISEEQLAGYTVTASSCTTQSLLPQEFSAAQVVGANTPSTSQTIDVVNGDSVTCIFTNTQNKPAGHVLGSSTTANPGKGAELVNTGQNAIANIAAGMLLISAAVGLWIFGGRRQAQN